MKRITLVIPDDLIALIQQERRRRDVSAATVIREALKDYFHGSGRPKRLPFIGIGASGFADTSERIDEIFAEEWCSAGNG